jgi:hypothetical protein
MLNKSFAQAEAAAAGTKEIEPSRVIDRKVKLFAPATVSPHHCQAQVLQFLACPDHPGSLQLVRIPVYSQDGTVYESGEADATILHFATA